jgi:hypothetical protein
MLWSSLRSKPDADWRLDEYPIRDVQQLAEDHEPGRFAVSQAWRSEVLGWPGMVGLGATRGHARAALRRRFEDWRESGQARPRPGRLQPLRFASDDRVSADEVRYVDFLVNVLEQDPEEAWVSDLSTLWHFAEGSGIEGFLHRIEQHYGLRVTDDDSPVIVDILERIAAHRREQGPNG